MLKVILGAPMLLVLKFKLKAMQKVLAMAEEQHKDAADLNCCLACVTSESGCTGAADCRLNKFKDNVALARTEIAEIEFRMKRLA